MKFVLVVRQDAAVEGGLVGKVTVGDLCLLFYLRGWFFCERAETKVVEGQKFVWVRCETAIEELPLLFNPQAQIASRKNQLSKMIEKLRKTGLVKTMKIGRRLYIQLTEQGIRLHPPSQRPVQTPGKPAPIITRPHDDTVTPGQDRIVTSPSDERRSAITYETGTTENERKETPPLSPSGEEESILPFWNLFSRLVPARNISPDRARKIRKRLADPFWREHWREGIQRAAASDFLTGGAPSGWRATLDWFLGSGTLVKVLEGQYDKTTAKRPPAPPRQFNRDDYNQPV